MKTTMFTVLVCVIFSCAAHAQKGGTTAITKPNTEFLTQLQAAGKRVTLKQYKSPSKVQKDFIELFKNTTNASSWGKKEYKSFMLLASRIVNNMNLSSDPDDGGEIFQDPDDGGEVFISTKKFIAAYNSLQKICTDVIFRCQWKVSN